MANKRQMICLAAVGAVLLLGSSGCHSTALPADRRRTVDPALLEGMYIVPVEWPDTMAVGEVAEATVTLLLANGVPYDPDRFAFRSPDIGIAGLSPTDNPASKLVIAFAPGKVSIVVDAYVGRSAAHCDCDDFHAQRSLDIVVVPAR